MALPSPRAAVNAYELERRQRIERNQAMLQEMGLLENPLSGAAAAAAAAQRHRQREASRRQHETDAAEEEDELQSPRRSRRLRGEDAPAAAQLPQRPLRVPESVAADILRRGGHGTAQAVADARMDAHTYMRIMTMSERALQTRIWRIKRVDKIVSFVRVLDQFGMAGLAAEARLALQQLGGNDPAVEAPQAPGVKVEDRGEGYAGACAGDSGGVAVKEEQQEYGGVEVKEERQDFGGVAVKEEQQEFGRVAVKQEEQGFFSTEVKGEQQAFAGVAVKEEQQEEGQHRRRRLQQGDEQQQQQGDAHLQAGEQQHAWPRRRRN